MAEDGRCRGISEYTLHKGLLADYQKWLFQAVDEDRSAWVQLALMSPEALVLRYLDGWDTPTVRNV